MILTADGWNEYELLDTGHGMRLERFGKYTLIRPDPQFIWKPHLDQSIWEKANAVYERTSGEKGNWIKKTDIPEKWIMKYNEISFYCKLTPFKHTGVFPEQQVHWRWITEKIIQAKRPVNILNLFAYTGISSLVAAKAGAKVTHIDASYPTIGWGKENQKLSGLDDKPMRWILDDVLKFTDREVRREVKYDGIIMDPPVYGHGPDNEKWDFNLSFPQLMETCKKILSDDPIFILASAYAISSSSIMLENVFNDYVKDLGGTVESGEMAIKENDTKRLASTGMFARWSKDYNS